MTLALLITAVGGAWAADTYTVVGSNSDMFGSTWDADATANDMTKNGDGTYSITYTNVYLDGDVQYKVLGNRDWENAYPIDDNRVINIAEAGTYTVTIHFNPTTHEVYETMPGSASAEPDVEVTTNAASAQDLFTEAKFNMPPFDATVNYELVRDMSIQMTTKIGDGNDGYRIRLKKNEQTGKYEPAEMTAQEMKELVKVHDAIENNDLTFGVLGANCIVNIYKANDENQAEGEPIAFADLAPGRYIAKAVAATGSAYEGETDMSNIFELFQGYEVTVPAGEFATFYKEEALGLGEEHYTAGAALYTITDVNGTTATATELEITTDEPPLAQVAPAYTPLLVYNGSDEDMRVLLIPTTSSATVSHFSGFTGSLESQTLWGGEGFYTCNGKQFVYVKNDLTLPANKCCLKITSGNSFEQGSRSITIVFEEATGVNEVIGVKEVNDGSWYDLNGRKLNGMPTKKGVYILNGKKVVVK